MIGVENYVDGDTFESIADFGFGDHYTTKHPLDINKLIRLLISFSPMVPIKKVLGLKKGSRL